SVMVCFTHTVYGASEIGKQNNKFEERRDAQKDEVALSDPAGSHEDLNQIIAAACAHTRGNGDI
ncbi:MAG: hypothetical protein Q8R43_03340, partial [Alphaproteobacteria bacterium]|nr:hypothetical protein [Alphaproteobacteria bacterium]